MVVRAYPERGLTLWRRVDFIGFLASPERVRPLFGYKCPQSLLVFRCQDRSESGLERYLSSNQAFFQRKTLLR